MPYIDLDLRPAAWVAVLTVVLIAVIRVVERYAYTAAARRTQRAIARSLRDEAPPRSAGAVPRPDAEQTLRRGDAPARSHK